MVLRTLHMRLLGDFSLVYGNEPLDGVKTPRLHSLLAYLVFHRDAPQPRHYLAFLFWPDAAEAQARNNLRQLLHKLRRALPDVDHFLYADTTTLRWRPDAPFTLDVDDFERTLALADAAVRRADKSTLRAALEQATNLYRADLLGSCYDDWIAPERERLRQRYLQVLSQLIQVLETRRDYAQAICYSQRLIQHDPLDEDAARRLMQLQALTGDRVEALHVYRTIATALQRELDIEPGPEIRDVYERLVNMDSQVASVAGRETMRHTVVAPSLPLIGRQREWEQLQEVWHQPGHRILCWSLAKQASASRELYSRSLVDGRVLRVSAARKRAAMPPRGNSRCHRSPNGCAARLFGLTFCSLIPCGSPRCREFCRSFPQSGPICPATNLCPSTDSDNGSSNCWREQFLPHRNH